MNGSRQAHFCFNVCLWLPESKCCNFDLHQLYIFLHLPAHHALLQELSCPSDGQRHKRWVHAAVLCLPSPPISQKEGVSGPRRSRYSLGAASASSLFQTHINFGSLTSSGEKFLIFKAPHIFPALGPLREKQTIFTFLLTLPFSGPQMDEKDHRDSFLRCFQREARADTKNAGRLLIACIDLQGRLTLKNVTLIAWSPRAGVGAVNDVQKSHGQSRELCCPNTQCSI